MKNQAGAAAPSGSSVRRRSPTPTSRERYDLEPFSRAFIQTSPGLSLPPPNALQAHRARETQDELPPLPSVTSRGNAAIFCRSCTFRNCAASPERTRCVARFAPLPPRFGLRSRLAPQGWRNAEYLCRCGYPLRRSKGQSLHLAAGHVTPGAQAARASSRATANGPDGLRESCDRGAQGTQLCASWTRGVLWMTPNP
eukprot:scaffold5336_cov258-Pinguiococcus_pyrenoidosus.AAC.1